MDMNCLGERAQPRTFDHAISHTSLRKKSCKAATTNIPHRIATLSRANVEPHKIISSLRNKNLGLLIAKQDISNIKTQIRVETLGPYTPIQA
jgi:hypothetical protein